MRHQSTRFRVLAPAAACLALVASGCGSSGDSGSSSGPITLGAIVTTSGPLAQIGQSHRAGAELAVKQINDAGGVLGRKLKLDVKDEQVDPNASVQAARAFLGSGTKLLFGLTTDSDCLAVAPIVQQLGGLLVGTSCQSNLLETTKFVPSFFEIAPNNFMLAKATAALAAQKFGSVKSWDSVAPDYEFGHEVTTSFQQDLSGLESDATYRKQVFVPLTETQFNSHITSLLSGLPADSATSTGLMMATFGATTIGLAKQGKSFDMFNKYATVINLGGSTPTAEALGADTPPMYFVYDYYDGAYDNGTNSTFVSGYAAANKGAKPNAWSYEGYTAVLAYKAAIEKAGSTDPAKVRAAMAGMTFDTPKGPLTFRAKDHLLQSPVTVWQVKPDSSSAGFSVTSSDAIPADQVLPPVKVG
ncbi:MAG TPA: ABC transporter substrate-binding protein [Mycobacteriales bacterium]|nr:ABC transporter substrate-binding protein [Mycobacteriales bacterium]